MRNKKHNIFCLIRNVFNVFSDDPMVHFLCVIVLPSLCIWYTGMRRRKNSLVPNRVGLVAVSWQRVGHYEPAGGGS